MRRWLAVVLAAAALAAAGCGGDAGEATTAAPSSPSATTSPTVDLLEKAAAEYLALVEATNPVIVGALEDVQEAGARDDGDAVAVGLRRFANGSQRFADGLLRIEMPGDVVGARDQLVRSARGSLDVANALAESFESGELLAAQDLADEMRRALSARRSDVAVLRSRLGLPPVGDQP